VTTRTLTVLFTDLVDSTPLMTTMDRDSADGVRARHFGGLRSALSIHRGREVKTLGDGTMAAFGSIGDALACAVTMQRSVARQNETHPGPPLAMRVGLSTGEVTEDDDDYFGTPVIEASRLCSAAGPQQILTTELVRMLVGSDGVHRVEPIGQMSLKGLPGPVGACEVGWADDEQSALRVALADDAALLRQGIARMLEAEGMEVVLEVEDAETLLAHLPAAAPHVAVLDVRMPPTHTTEGLDAADRIRREHPGVGVVVLSAEVHPSAARRLLDGGTDGVGYLLKERVGDVAELTAAIRTVASGGSAIDPEVAPRMATPRDPGRAPYAARRNVRTASTRR
jgi:class 3 adenylate cyclase/DNA-binding NarL/FixJ family response regulator